LSIHDHLSTFGGLKVLDWVPGDPLPDGASMVRLSVDWDGEDTWPGHLRAFLELPDVDATPGLVVGWWGERPEDVTAALASARDRLPNLRVLFFGDVTSEENEVSWIENGDLSPLLSAYPDLTHLGVRGGNDLSLGELDLPELRHLTVQSGGLPVEVVREVMRARLPRLEHLELFLGWSGYGGESEPDDLAPLLGGTLFPELKYLGLKNSDRLDEMAPLLAGAPVLQGLGTLDLSLGGLSDEGAQALLGSPHVPGLKRLILRGHDLTPETLQRLAALGPEVDTEEGGDLDPDEEWRYVTLSE